MYGFVSGLLALFPRPGSVFMPELALFQLIALNCAGALRSGSKSPSVLLFSQELVFWCSFEKKLYCLSRPFFFAERTSLQ